MPLFNFKHLRLHVCKMRDEICQIDNEANVYA